LKKKEMQVVMANKQNHGIWKEQNYKCPNCKHAISITNADFIRGIAMTSCQECGRNAFAFEDILLNN
jgi:transcription elongation factor Elf1